VARVEEVAAGGEVSEGLEPCAEPVPGVASGVLLIEGGLVIGRLGVTRAFACDPRSVDELVVFAEANEHSGEDPGDGGEVNLTVTPFGPGEGSTATVSSGVVLSSQLLAPYVV